MEALTDLEALREMLKEIVWAPNKAFGTMMKRDAERFAERFVSYCTPEDEARLEQALEYALMASGSLADKEHYKYSAMTAWSFYERAVRTKVRSYYCSIG